MKKLIAMACTVFTLWSQAQTLTDSLIICMPMNNSPSDFSGNSNNGTVSGSGLTGTSNRFGQPNKAYHFGGSGYIDVPGTTTSVKRIEQTNELSISVWLQVDNWGTNLFPILEKYDTPITDNGWSYAFFDPAIPDFDTMDMYFVNPSVTWPGPSVSPYGDLTPVPVGTSTWRHYVMTYSKLNNRFQYFVDGYLHHTSTLTVPFTLFHTAGSIRIGYSEAGPNEYANGDMDELRVYNRELTATEAYQLFADTTLSCATKNSTVTPPPPSTGCCLGNACGATSNPLTGSYEVPMKNHNFNFTAAKNSAAEVMIGYPNCSTGTARLDVTDDNIGNGIRGYCSTQAKNNIGVYGIGSDPNSKSSAFTSIGVLGETGPRLPRGYTAGVAGFGGGAAVLTALPPGQDIGVYGNSLANKARWAGYFDGDVNINGAAWCSAMAWTSDKRFKTNIKELESVSEKIQKLKGYTYNFKVDEFKERNFDKSDQIGFIAQELKEVFPQLVKEDDKGYLAVNYIGMIPVLLEAIKEQAAENNTQQQQINELKALVSSLAGNGAGSANKTGLTSVPVTLSDKNAVVLNQNVPNPFAESTVITYSLPSDFTNAQIVFTSENGTVIKTVEIREKGQGSLNVFANDLSHGMYSYTLVIDGKNVSTKKMIKE